MPTTRTRVRRVRERSESLKITTVARRESAGDDFLDGPIDPAWKRYEKQIRDYLIDKCGDQAEISYDQKVRGTLSGIERQADIWVTGIFAGFVEDGTALVDCKHFSTNVDVKEVEAF